MSKEKLHTRITYWFQEEVFARLNRPSYPVFSNAFMETTRGVSTNGEQFFTLRNPKQYLPLAYPGGGYNLNSLIKAFEDNQIFYVLRKAPRFIKATYPSTPTRFVQSFVGLKNDYFCGKYESSDYKLTISEGSIFLVENSHYDTTQYKNFVKPLCMFTVSLEAYAVTKQRKYHLWLDTDLLIKPELKYMHKLITDYIIEPMYKALNPNDVAVTYSQSIMENVFTELAIESPSLSKLKSKMASQEFINSIMSL